MLSPSQLSFYNSSFFLPSENHAEIIYFMLLQRQSFALRTRVERGSACPTHHVVSYNKHDVQHKIVVLIAPSPHPCPSSAHVFPEESESILRHVLNHAHSVFQLRFGTENGLPSHHTTRQVCFVVTYLME